ncbi:TroA family protein [Paenibacillus puerhi]|uniref:hypothetical protein n=1 Tax=Paenibacillus puerhi TaxID=2692622 RepID=UPI0013572631|nr:hypothetical protein [Paenibacillus puerhi]
MKKSAVVPYRKQMILLPLALAILLAACGKAHTPERIEERPVSPDLLKEKVNLQKDANSDFPATVVLDDGMPVLIPSKPERIAALSLDAAEAVLELVAPERVAVVTRSAADPALAFHADLAELVQAKINGATSLDPEKVMSFNTDLLVMTKGHDKE